VEGERADPCGTARDVRRAGQQDTSGGSVEIKVGIQHVNREVVVETTETAADVEKAFADAVENEGVFTLSDERGRRVLIPSTKIAYVDLGEEHARKVGFGTL
jgi:hypothetical protein